MDSDQFFFNFTNDEGYLSNWNHFRQFGSINQSISCDQNQKQDYQKQDSNLQNQRLESIEIDVSQQIFVQNNLSTSSSPYKYKKIKVSKPIHHKTKNLLQVFKRLFLKEILKLKKQDRQKLYIKEHVQSIAKKNHITMVDYQILFNQPKLRTKWKSFFAKKVVYRHLMTAGSSLEQKKIYWQKIGLFEQAFLEQCFERMS